MLFIWFYMICYDLQMPSMNFEPPLLRWRNSKISAIWIICCHLPMMRIFLNSSESKLKLQNGIVEYEENDCELVKTVKIGANPLKTSFNTIKSFFMSTFTPPQTQTRTQTQTKIKGQTSIAAFFKPPKRLPEEPIELEETKKWQKLKRSRSYFRP